MPIVSIHYSISPQTLAKQWMNGEVSLDQALTPVNRVVKGELTDDMWNKYRHLFPWSNINDVWTLRADAVPVKTLISGHVDLSMSTPQHVSVDFKLRENKKTWHALKAYSVATELLDDLKKHTLNDFADPRLQDSLAIELGRLFTTLYAEWDLPGLEAKFPSYVERLAKLVQSYHPQWSHLRWVQYTASGEEIPDGGFEWNGHMPIHWESLRLLYYVTQGFSIIDKNNGTLWVAPPATAFESIDLSCLTHRTMATHQKTRERKALAVKQKYNPGGAERAEKWMHGFKSYIESQFTHELDAASASIIWNTAIIADYAQKLTDSDIWSYEASRMFILDINYRKSVLEQFSKSALGHGTYLDDALAYWEHGEFATISSSVKPVSVALKAMRGYYIWLLAQNEGLVAPAIEIFKESDLNSIKRKNADTEIAKKMAPYINSLELYGPIKYFAPVPELTALDELKRKFPNFSELCDAVVKQLRLSSLQPNATIKLHPTLLVGDPGWGKTRFLKAMADALSVPLHEIAMSSVTAGFVLSGSDFTWHGAKPGRVADIIMHDVCANPLIVLDEIDKVSGEGRNDPYGPLYQLLEKHTASRFVDEALQIAMDTQYFSWFATANDIERLPDPIKSRFDIFEIPALTRDQSVIVAQSIYDDLLSEHLWGDYFDALLSEDIGVKLHGNTARGMYLALRNACANAAIRTERPLKLQISDFEIRGSNKKSGNIGFIANS